MRSDSAPLRVLVTGVGGPSGISVMRALSAHGVDVTAADIDPYAAGLYLVEEPSRVLLPRGDDPEFADRLLEECRRRRVDAVVPTVDVELLPLARERERYRSRGVGLVLASEGALAICLDKWRLFVRCRGSVPVPDTRLCDGALDVDAIDLPAIVKPRAASGSRGVRLVDDRSTLRRLPRDGSLLVQEHLPGPEFSLDVLADAHGAVAAVVPRARLKVDSGVAVAARSMRDERLERLGGAVAGHLGLGYVANVQVKGDRNGRPALLEVNPRFPGTMPLTVAAGIDMPWLALRHALGEPLPPPPAFRELAVVRYLEDRVLDPEEIARLERGAHMEAAP